MPTISKILAILIRMFFNEQIIVLLFVSFVTSANASQISDDAISAYNKGNYKVAEKLFRSCASNGEANCQFGLGLMYDKGDGILQNYKEAAQWYRMAAEQGMGVAQNVYAIKCDDGEGVPQNYIEATKWFLKAAQQGITSAQFQLGIRYFQGKGVTKNKVKGYAWVVVAKANGHQAAEQAMETMSLDMAKKEIEKAQFLAPQLYKEHKSAN